MNPIFDRSERDNDYERDALTSRENSQESTTINSGMRLVGEVEGTHDFYLNGELEGKINISELIKIGRTGGFKGEMKAKNVIIEGHVDGKVSAEQRVEIRDSGHFTGDIESPSVSISDKAYFQGSVTMTREATPKPADAIRVVRDDELEFEGETESVDLLDDDDEDLDSEES